MLSHLQNFSDVWLRKILDLGKQLNLMIRVENVLQDVMARRFEEVLKRSWKRAEAATVGVL